ncbi:hypothetical protein BkAM31D_23970 [Halalkalibacter krulwichiae]|uniref:Uncharacterized protein n=2 Tax=Halalkalibacter krulwichiae TaxID=199441 RepID=A0A1X9MK50_9BACI|nr:hypothetical protein BkAM31D_23970 [Halalkalibacter krulwichiae]
MKRKVFAVIGLLSVALFVYVFAVNNDQQAALQEPEIKELVHEYSVGNIQNENASITSHELIVTDSDGSQVVYELPEDEFFVSIAPYYDHTHP